VHGKRDRLYFAHIPGIGVTLPMVTPRESTTRWVWSGRSISSHASCNGQSYVVRFVAILYRALEAERGLCSKVKKRVETVTVSSSHAPGRSLGWRAPCRGTKGSSVRRGVCRPASDTCFWWRRAQTKEFPLAYSCQRCLLVSAKVIPIVQIRLEPTLAMDCLWSICGVTAPAKACYQPVHGKGNGADNRLESAGEPLVGEAVGPRVLMEDLSEELIATIFRHVNCATLYGTLGRVCSVWHRIASDRRTIGMAPCVRRKTQEMLAKARVAKVDVDDASALQGFLNVSSRQSKTAKWLLFIDAISFSTGHSRSLLLPTKPTLAATARGPSSSDSCPSSSSSSDDDDGGGTADGAAARNCILYAHVEGCPRFRLACCDAARDGLVDVLMRLMRTGHTLNVAAVCSAAAKHNHIGVLKMLVRANHRLDSVLVPIAARAGHTHIIRYARKNRCSWKASACASAALGGHLDCIRYMHENGCPWNEDTCINAAKAGHLASLRYAREMGCPWNQKVVTHAATNGHMDCLVWAVEHGCPLDKGILKRVAKRGDLAMVEYLHERGYVLSNEIMTAASRSGNVQLLDYLTTVRCPVYEKAVLARAAKHGHLAVLQWAYGTFEECRWKADMCAQARRNGHRECVRFLLEHGCPRDVPLVLLLFKRPAFDIYGLTTDALFVSPHWGCICAKGRGWRVMGITATDVFHLLISSRPFPPGLRNKRPIQEGGGGHKRRLLSLSLSLPPPKGEVCAIRLGVGWPCMCRHASLLDAS